MSLTLVTAPQGEPLATAELLEHVRELDTTQASYLEALGTAAREYVESFCRRALLTQTWKLLLDEFPEADFIRLPRPPLQSVTTLKYRDTAGTLTTWDASNYVVDTASLPGRVHLAYGTSWPSTRCQANAVEITYLAGYGDDPEAIPEGLKHALKLFVGHFYNIREPVITGTIVTKVPLSIEALLWPHRVLEF